jgi:hypothetical protein
MPRVPHCNSARGGHRSSAAPSRRKRWCFEYSRSETDAAARDIRRECAAAGRPHWPERFHPRKRAQERLVGPWLAWPLARALEIDEAALEAARPTRRSGSISSVSEARGAARACPALSQRGEIGRQFLRQQTTLQHGTPSKALEQINIGRVRRCHWRMIRRNGDDGARISSGPVPVRASPYVRNDPLVRR